MAPFSSCRLLHAVTFDTDGSDVANPTKRALFHSPYHESMATKPIARKAVAKIAVTVNSRPWTRVSVIRNSGPNDAVYVLDPKDGTIRFGDGVHGRVPPTGASIGVRYSYGGGASGNVSRRIDKTSDLGGSRKETTGNRLGKAALLRLALS